MTALSMIVHAESKVGKSWFSGTMPGPRLYLDIESRSRFVPLGRRVAWDPRQSIPDDIDEGTTVVVKVTDFDAVGLVYQWLAAGKHPFRSLIVDSLTELQKRLVDKIAGAGQMETQGWGELLRRMESLVRKMRDLSDPPAGMPPLNVLFICGSVEKDGKVRPLLQGALGNSLAYHVDLVGHMDVRPDPSNPAAVVRCLRIQPTLNVVAGDGTDILTQHYGPEIMGPDFSAMLAVLGAPSVASVLV